MKKLFLVALSVFAVNAICAQETSNVSKSEYTKSRAEAIEARAQRDVDALNKELTLTDDQKKKVHDFSLVKLNKLKEIRAKNSSNEANNDAQRKSDLNAVMNEYKANIKSILTPGQIEKFNTF